MLTMLVEMINNIDNVMGAELSFLFWVTLEMTLLFFFYKYASKLIDVCFEED